MAKNSLFGVLMRSPWWVSLCLGVVLAVLLAALLPADYRVAGALSSTPFAVIAALAARRQWQLPSAAQVEQTVKAVGTMTWPQFSTLLEQAFRRDGHTVQRHAVPAFDFELERKGRTMVVAARRWKSARNGLEGLRALQAAREERGASDALVICLGEITDNARSFAAEHRIAVWQAAELAQAVGKLTAGAITR